MSNVAESTDLIQVESVEFRAAASESTMTLIAGAVNYALNRTTVNKNILLKKQDFTVSGSWAAPANLSQGFVVCIGSGGGGGGGNASSGVNAQGGGAANYCIRVLAVTAGVTYNFVIGTGGAGAAGNSGQDGANGINTTFNGNLVGTAGNGGYGSTNFTTATIASGYGVGGGGAPPGIGGSGGTGNAGTGGNGNIGATAGTAGSAGKLTLVWFENPITT